MFICVFNHETKGQGLGWVFHRVSLPPWQGLRGGIVGIELNRPGVYLMPESLEMGVRGRV